MPNGNPINYNLLKYQADNIPNFDGNPRLLQRFVNACENFLKAFQNVQNAADPINICLFDTILSKLRDRAADLIAPRSELNNWILIKDALIATFADQRSIDCLIQDLISLKPFRNETPLQFGTRIQDTRSLLFAKLNATNEDNGIKLVKITHYEEFALKTFINGLPYNMQLVVRLKNPNSLEQAMSFVTEEENFVYFKTGQNQNFRQPIHNTIPYRPRPMTLPKPNIPNFRPNIPIHPQPLQPNFNFPQYRPQFPVINNPPRFGQFPAFGTQSNTFNQPRPNFPNFVPQRPSFPNNIPQPRPIFPSQNYLRQQQNQFNPFYQRTNITNTSKPKPEPMDTSSATTTKQTQRPFQSKELFNQDVIENLPENNPNTIQNPDCTVSYEPNYDVNYEQDYYTDYDTYYQNYDQTNYDYSPHDTYEPPNQGEIQPAISENQDFPNTGRHLITR